MIAIDLNKQQVLDANPKGIQQFNFTRNLDRAGNTALFFIIQEAKKKHFRFFARNYESLVNLFCIKMVLI